MRADGWVRKAERESKLVDALLKARYLISMHNRLSIAASVRNPSSLVFSLGFTQLYEARRKSARSSSDSGLVR